MSFKTCQKRYMNYTLKRDVRVEATLNNSLPQVKSSVLNQHIRYTPRKRIHFNLLTPEGRMALVFKGDEAAYGNMWKLSMYSNIAVIVASYFVCPIELIYFIQPSLFLSLGFCYNRFSKL